jgi:hypothetical protein
MKMQRSGIDYAAKAITIAATFIILLSFVVMVTVTVFTLDHPESIGEWFGRLFSGFQN